MKTDKKPPLAKSPMRLRGRRPPRSSTATTVTAAANITTPFRTPALSTKPQMKASDLRPQYQSVSCELKALSQMVQDELGAMNAKATGFPSYASTGGSNLFERGRFYDVYSERRNERLRKKLSESESESLDDEPKTAYNLGVKLDSTKKRESKKKCDSLKKSMMAVTYSVDRSQHPRYALRSTMKKPPLPVPMDVDENMTSKKAPSARTRRK